ncbi:TetR/AcrR family transcriptional regulator [Streptomyces sp. NPDC090741]|uniref:TetR/AcrR family transcriptional regulator n=1 Tax=Streptomyces sp. NPDC090741 TaxID=3365967 RepID=UPI0037F5AC36
MVMTTGTGAGRGNQKQRTRTAIVEAARALIATGAEVTMPAIARAALVSEATAYRYFPDLPSLIGESLAGAWPAPADALRPVARSTDPANGWPSPASSCSAASSSARGRYAP